MQLKSGIIRRTVRKRANWKRCRLPGTEDMDKEYRSNNRKSITDVFFGMAIGLAVALAIGKLTEVLF